MPKITVHGGASNAAGYVRVHGGAILPTTVEGPRDEQDPVQTVEHDEHDEHEQDGAPAGKPKPAVSRETAPRGRRRKG